MKCPLCGNQFREAEGVVACKGCDMVKGCQMVKCPGCGYEVPKEPRLPRFVRNLLRRDRDGA